MCVNVKHAISHYIVSPNHLLIPWFRNGIFTLFPWHFNVISILICRNIGIIALFCANSQVSFVRPIFKYPWRRIPSRPKVRGTWNLVRTLPLTIIKMFFLFCFFRDAGATSLEKLTVTGISTISLIALLYLVLITDSFQLALSRTLTTI